MSFVLYHLTLGTKPRVRMLSLDYFTVIFGWFKTVFNAPKRFQENWVKDDRNRIFEISVFLHGNRRSYITL